MPTVLFKYRKKFAQILFDYRNNVVFCSRKNFIQDNNKGFIILSKSGTVNKSIASVNEFKDISVLFGNANAKLPHLLKNLLEFQAIRNVFDVFQNVYKVQNLKFDLNELLNSYQENNIIHALIGTVIIQMGLYETLKSINLRMDNIYGSFVGTLTLSYAKDYLSIEEVAVISYLTALLLNEYYKTVDYNKKTLSKEDADSLTKKLHEFIRQIMYNKKGHELNKTEEDLVYYLVENLLNGNNTNLIIPKNSVLLECGTSNRTGNGIEVMQIVNYDCQNPVVNLLSNLGR